MPDKIDSVEKNDPTGHTSGLFPAGISTLLFMYWKIRSL